MSANRVPRIHPASHPSHDILTGHRGGPLGFWRGPDIDVVGVQQVNPHVSRDIARQWLIDEGIVVDAADHAACVAELDQAQAKIDELMGDVAQLQKRLGRVYPRSRAKKVRG